MLYEAEIKKLLDGVADLLHDEINWCKRGNARKADNSPCAVMYEKASKWDVFGALMKISKEMKLHPQVMQFTANILINRIPKTSRVRDVESYNDKLTHAEMLEWIKFEVPPPTPVTEAKKDGVNT